jgi:hypothetical protein
MKGNIQLWRQQNKRKSQLIKNVNFSTPVIRRPDSGQKDAQPPRQALLRAHNNADGMRARDPDATAGQSGKPKYS